MTQHSMWISIQTESPIDRREISSPENRHLDLFTFQLFPTGIRIVEPSGSVRISYGSNSSAIRTRWEKNRHRSRKMSTFAVRRYQVWRNTRHHVISYPRRCPTQHPCHRSVRSRTARKFMFINFFSQCLFMDFRGILACRPLASLSPNSCSMEAKLFNVNTKLDERRFFWNGKIKINHENLVKIL